MKEYSTDDPADQAEHDRLMQMAQESDAEIEANPEYDGSASATQAEAGSEEKAETRVDGQAGQSEGKQSDSPETSAEPKTEAKESQPRGEDGKFLPKEQKQEPEKTDAEATKYERARKEEERKTRSWQALEAEKAEVRAREARLAAIEEKVNTLGQRPQGGSSTEPRFSSQQFRIAAQGFTKRGNELMEEGDLEGMREQFKLAGEAARAANQAYQEELQVAGAQFGERWQASAVEIIKQHPELDDPQTPQAQAVANVLQRAPLLEHIQDGFAWACELAYGRLAAARVSGLEEENKKLRTENESFKKLTSPLGGRTTSGHSQGTPFDRMTTKEQHDYLERQAELADAT